MQNEMYQCEPNLIAKAYRNQTNLQMPRRLERHFDFLDISDDGFLLLGTSNLCGRIWCGSVWVFNGCPLVPDVENCVAGIEFKSSVACGLWLDSKEKIIVGCDLGTLHDLSLNVVEDTKKNYFSTNAVVSEHDDSIIALDFLKNKTKIVSGSMDMNIKVWNAEILSSEKSYCPAHGHIVTSIACQTDSADIFASTSLDGTTLLWDIRQEKPASLIVKNDCGFTASSWNDDKCISIGSSDGSVSLVDLRSKLALDQKFCSTRPIFKLRFNTELDLMAVCADDPIIRVFSCKQKSLITVYENDQHKDFVRGLAWEPNSNVLYSCSWDSKILSHEIPKSELGEINDGSAKKEEVQFS